MYGAKDQILAIVHAVDSSLGRVGHVFQNRGLTIDRRCPTIGDPLPDDLELYQAVVIMGGPQSANDDHDPAIAAELRWIEERLFPAELPSLGVCLGAQMFSRVLGGRVGPHPDAIAEIGYFKLQPTVAGQSFLQGPQYFYQWHAETFEIPRGAIHLATSERFSNQAFTYGSKIIGIEFHPEITAATIERWCQSKGGAKQIAETGAALREIQLEDHARYHDAAERWLERFVDLFLCIGAESR